MCSFWPSEPLFGFLFFPLSSHSFRYPHLNFPCYLSCSRGRGIRSFALVFSYVSLRVLDFSRFFIIHLSSPALRLWRFFPVSILFFLLTACVRVITRLSLSFDLSLSLHLFSIMVSDFLFSFLLNTTLLPFLSPFSPLCHFSFILIGHAN